MSAATTMTCPTSTVARAGTVPGRAGARLAQAAARGPVAALRVSTVARADASGETRNSESGIFMRQITEAEREEEVKYLAGMLKLWLDDEWSIQEPHAALGLQAAEKCVAMRLDGCEEMGSLVMGIAQDLLSFDFSDTFVNSFEVANKTSEILMMREGYEVCCLSKEDETRQARYEEMVANGQTP